MIINLHSKEELIAIINGLECSEDFETEAYNEMRENNGGEMNDTLTMWRESINNQIALRERLEVIRRYHS